MSDRAYPKFQAQQKTLIGSSPKSSLLRRTCACGQHTIVGGECEACRKTRNGTMQRAAVNSAPVNAVPPVVHDVLSSPGQPLDAGTRTFMEPRFGHDFSRIPIHSTQTAVPQMKLTVNQPGDIYEQEADQVAEQVMRIADLQTSVSDNEGGIKNSLMRKQTSEPGAHAATDTSSVPPVVHDVLNSGGGQPLDTATRAFMKPRFGHDFSKVRIHADERAAESAQSINALAYTVGNDIVFGASQYAPMTAMGQRLLAHELTHTIQQSTHGLAVQCQGAPPASTPTPAPALTLPPSTIADFCKPFTSRSEAQQARTYLLQKFIPLDKELFGPEVGGLWESYLNRKNGASLARRVFSSPSSSIVQGFARSKTTQDRQKELVDKILAALPTSCPTLPANTPTNFPVSRFLSKEDLEFPINFDKPFEIPGHIAGDVGSSDAGPDLRRVSGTVTLRRDTDASGKTVGILLMTNFQFLVQDAIDFCPGNPGAGFEQGLTIPLSRLEATGLFLQDEPFAYDVPFEVRYSGIPIELDLDLALVKRCFPDATGRAEPEPSPTPKPSPKPPSDRFFDRE